MAYVAVGRNQLLRGGGLATHFGIGAGHDHAGTAGFGAFSECIDNGKMGNVFGIGAVDSGDVLQGVEILTPRIGNATGVGEVVFVHLFDVRGVSAKQISVA